MTALVALRDAVGALTEAFPEQTFDTPRWWTRLKLDTKQLPFTSCQQLIDMWRALQGDLNAAERLRMALLPETRMLIKQQDDGRWASTFSTMELAAFTPSSPSPAPSPSSTR